jgi:soluble lytic murein transglycosylase
MAASRITRRPARRQGTLKKRAPEQARRRAAVHRRRTMLKRIFAVVLAVGGGLLIGKLVALPDKIDRALLEVTLPLRHDDIIRQQAQEKGMDPALIAAVIYAESKFVEQTSHAGARGLMQITPATARDIERHSGGTTFRLQDLSDPDINIRYGTYRLRELMDRYGDNETAALAAYNAGEGNADKWGGADMSPDDIRFPETRAYVAEVEQKQQDYRQKYARELGY